ncbi:MAG TPA: hypothetical protein VFP84_09070, partial [Kofleriaceae bacterium]|nr:hypothetical protein [Kofleriaceae bacterium]
SLPRLHTQPTPITVIPAAASPSGPARRLGKGTVPIDASHAPEPSDPLQAEIAAMAEMSDDTSIDLSIGDRTTPGIVMPVAARAAQVPSGKRRAAQRG